MAETIEGLCYIVILETVAANLGSMLLPMGNPQNLFLYSKSGLGVLAFIKHMIPWTALGAIILSFSILKLPSKRFPKVILESEKIDIKRTSVYVVLFLLCILAVFRVLNVYIVLLLSFLTVIFMDRKLIFSIDYSLLITFALFFIFVGNISRIHSLSSYISHAVLKNELILSISISQFISNMPTAILLSGFSNDYKTLLIGINLGGLGSLIASMASLISYQYISESHPDLKKKYIIDFTLFNIITLLIMIAIYFLFKI